MQQDFVVISRHLLSELVGMAREHLNDIESGLEDGTYSEDENENLPDKLESVALGEFLLEMRGD